MKIVKTPLRISLFGGGTDFPEYFKNNKSLIIGSSINKFIFTFIPNSHLECIGTGELYVSKCFRAIKINGSQVNYFKEKSKL